MDDSCSIGIKAGTYDEDFFTYIHFLGIALFLRGLTFSWFRKHIFYPSGPFGFSYFNILLYESFSIGIFEVYKGFPIQFRIVGIY